MKYKTSQISFVCAHLNGFKYRKPLNISIWPGDGSLTGTTTLIESRPESNGKGVLHIPQISKTGALPSDSSSYQGHSLSGWVVVLPLCEDAASIFYSPNWLGFNRNEYTC